MYAFISSYKSLSNVLKNEVRVAKTVEEGAKDFSEPYLGLWDTGATCSVITQKIVNDLGLHLVHYGFVSGVHGRVLRPYYYIDILLSSKANDVIIRKLYAPLGEPSGCDLLIGMDVIGRGDFAVSNYDGKTTFTFRFPSKQKTDYVRQDIVENKIGKPHGKGKRKRK